MLDTVKVMHCADIHLGSEISSLGHLGMRRRAEIKQSFFDILKLCRQQEVQYLLIAGDLFEHAVPDKGLVQEVAEEFARLDYTRVMIAPGNHDYYSEDSHYVKKGWYPDNVTIFKGGWECTEFPDDNLNIWGAGFTSMYQRGPLLMGTDRIDNSGRIQIGVLHGDLVSASKESNYNPVTRQQIKDSHMDYLALGHIHMRTEILKAGETYYSYCGCHEGRGFDELGDKGIYMGEVGKEGCSLEFIPCSKRAYMQLEVDLTGTSNDTSAAERISKAIYEAAGDTQAAENLYKILLQGTLEEGVVLHIEELKAKLQEFYYIKFRDELELRVDYDALAKEKTLKGMFVKRMLGEIELLEKKGRKKEVLAYRQGLSIGLKAFSGEVKYREDK